MTAAERKAFESANDEGFRVRLVHVAVVVRTEIRTLLVKCVGRRLEYMQIWGQSQEHQEPMH